MTDKELEAIKERILTVEAASLQLGVASPTVGDLRALVAEVETLRKRQKLLLEIADSALAMLAAGVGRLRGSFQNLKREWPDWADHVDKSTGPLQRTPSGRPFDR